MFSSAVSARMFCDLAWAPDDVALGEDGLVVSDPDTGGSIPQLPWARLEAQAIHDTFYPHALHLGRTDDGRLSPGGEGTVEQVRAWLQSGSGAITHLACHGAVQPGKGDEPTSYLVLEGGRKLAAEDLVAALTAERGRRLGLAVLAACSSGVTGRGYDEAYSIGTALLASGTRSVVSALWEVPDSATSVLMFMFHHFLRKLPAADALHAAQLWMLRPDRKIPDSMPADLRERIGDPTDETAWAGFVHAGR
ncbi:MAG: hypothetical protein JWO79_17 [Actinomycetia bacterium]|nr:hypothetical protein [Actinomycetes bacterium]